VKPFLTLTALFDSDMTVLYEIRVGFSAFTLRTHLTGIVFIHKNTWIV